MDLDLNRALDSAKEGTKEIAETAQEKAKEFHENYVSEVLPDCGKYGDAAKFAAELVPGVSEYNAIREGDWKALAISAGIDVGAVAVGAFTAGAGSAAVKSSLEAAKTGTKELAKEGLEEGTTKTIEKVATNGVAKTIEETVHEGIEISVKEVDEVAQIVKNKRAGVERETKVLKDLTEKYGENNVIREALLRDSTGTPIKDIVTNEARRIDAVVIQGEKVLRSLEVTSENAVKGLQMAKERRILEQAKDLGGAFIKNPETGELIKFGEEIATEIVRVA